MKSLVSLIIERLKLCSNDDLKNLLTKRLKLCSNTDLKNLLTERLKLCSNDNLKTLLTERLKLNKDTKVKQRNLDNWSILNAKPGDLVQCVDYKIFFMYKGLGERADINNIIEYYWLVDLRDNFKHLKDKPGWGVGTADDPNKFKLASEEDKQKIYNFIDKKGYKLDKFNLVKI